MKSADFFATHPVFRHEQFLAARAPMGRSVCTGNNLLSQHFARGRLIRVRRGLYAAVPYGISAEEVRPDPYLIASSICEDATVACHAALQFHGKAYSIWHRFHYLCPQRSRPFTFQQMQFIPVLAPAGVDLYPGTAILPHAGGQIRVTTLERTLVDVFDAPGISGGWEEIYRSLEMVEFFELDAVIDYAIARGSALTIARVGFFLEQYRDSLMVEERHLATLRAHSPAQPRYYDSTRQPGTLLPAWNLIVPTRILERHWAEAG